MKNRGKFAILAIAILALTLSACGQKMQTNADKPLKKVQFALDWTPNTNHSGLFVAKEEGYFAEEGLDVSLTQTDMNFIEMVGTGSAELGIASQEQVMQARASSGKVPIKAVAAIIQHNTSGFASPADRNITSPKEFEGKTYSGWGTELELSFIRSLMEKVGGDFGKVKIINQSATNYFASMETEADFAWIYYGWDGVSAEVQNYPLNFILLQEVDPRIDFYSPVLIAGEKVLEEDPELVRAFLRAAKKGYEKAIADPDVAVQALLANAKELDPTLLEKSQLYLNEKYIDDAKSWGEMKPEVWANFGEWMQENELLDSEIPVEDAYTNEFLPN